jgi:hypothetical protein
VIEWDGVLATCSSTLVYWVKLYNFHTYQEMKKCQGIFFFARFRFLPFRYEFWDRGFVKSCPIMETAERNFFHPYFLAKNGLKTKITEHFDRLFCFSFGGPDGGQGHGA